MSVCSDRSRQWLLIIIVGLLLVATVPGTGQAHLHSSESADATEVAITEDLEDTYDAARENGTETIEIVVQLERAPVASVSEPAVDDVLEEHAEESQTDLLEYADNETEIEVMAEFWVTNAVVLEVDPTAVDLETIGSVDEVTALYENFEIPTPEPDIEPTTLSEDDDSVKQKRSHTATYGVAGVNAPAVWDTYDTRGEGVTVAVLDTGVDASHPDIDLHTDNPNDPTYPGGWAEFNDHGERVPGSVPADSGTHGTHVSGTVAGGNATGVHVGVAPDVTLLHGRVLGPESGTFAQMIAGMEWAVKQEADVVSMSFGAIGTYDALVRPVRNIEQSGAVPVGAIGNDGPGVSGSPANVYDALAVGAVDRNRQVVSFSGGGEIERGSWRSPPANWPATYTTPDIVAPGVSVGSTVPGGYSSSSGTSMAAPHVSGVIALMLAVNGELSPETVTNVITETATKPADAPPTKDDRYGHGVIDAMAAVDSVAATGETAADTGTDSPADTTPGFGVATVLTAAVLVSLLVRRRR